MENSRFEFRGWNKKTKRMVDYHKVTPLAVHADLLSEGLDGVFIPFSKELEIMQFTGLCDRNGKKIFEGDLRGGTYYQHVNSCTPDRKVNFVEVMKWCEKGACFQWEFVSGGAKPSFIQTEIIGNIYQNPELLEQ